MVEFLLFKFSKLCCSACVFRNRLHCTVTSNSAMIVHYDTFVQSKNNLRMCAFA